MNVTFPVHVLFINLLYKYTCEFLYLVSYNESGMVHSTVHDKRLKVRTYILSRTLVPIFCLFANSDEPDEMTHSASCHVGLHCLPN